MQNQGLRFEIYHKITLVEILLFVNNLFKTSQSIILPDVQV